MIEDRDKPLFRVLCLIAALFVILIFSSNTSIEVVFKTGTECDQYNLVCVAYRWQPLIGGSFAIIAAAIAWISIETQQIRTKRQIDQTRVRRLKRTMNDLKFIRDQARSIRNCFLKICPNDSGPYNFTYELVLFCRKQPFAMPRHQEMGMSAGTLYQLETVNTVLTQFANRAKKKFSRDQVAAHMPIDDLKKILDGAVIVEVQLDIFIKDLEADIQTVRSEILNSKI